MPSAPSPARRSNSMVLAASACIAVLGTPLACASIRYLPLEPAPVYAKARRPDDATSVARASAEGGSAASQASTARLAERGETGAANYEQLASVRAFRGLRTTLEELEGMVLEDSRDEREAFEGMRFLIRALAMSADVSLDGNAKAPHFARMDTPVRKVGGDNPDAEYDHLTLDGRRDYRITGNIGTVKHLSFTVNAAGTGGRRSTIGYVNERTIGPDANGDFTLWITRSDPKRPGAWIRSDPSLTGLLVRQYIASRDDERLATYDVEVIGAKPYELAPWTDQEVARALTATTYTLHSLSTLHRTVMPELLDRPNQFVRANSDDFGADISGSDNLYMFGTFDIGPDEALIIEVPPLDVQYWNLAVESRWHESVDYMKRRTHRSMDDAVIDPDGMLRFVLAEGRSPHPNWLDTAGHGRGFLTFRWVGPRGTQAELPKITRLPRAEVPARLAALQRR